MATLIENRTLFGSIFIVINHLFFQLGSDNKRAKFFMVIANSLRSSEFSRYVSIAALFNQLSEQVFDLLLDFSCGPVD